MKTLLSATFWTYAGERAIKTAAQTAVALLGTGTVGLLSIDLVGLLSAAAGAALLSVLTSVAGFTPDE